MKKLDEILGKRTLKEMLDEPAKDVLDVKLPDVKGEKALEKVDNKNNKLSNLSTSKGFKKRLASILTGIIIVAFVTVPVSVPFGILGVKSYAYHYLKQADRYIAGNVVKKTDYGKSVSLEIKTDEGIYIANVRECVPELMDSYCSGNTFEAFSSAIEENTKVMFVKDVYTLFGYKSKFNQDKIGALGVTNIKIIK